jgi:hypothetical protein
MLGGKQVEPKMYIVRVVDAWPLEGWAFACKDDALRFAIRKCWVDKCPNAIEITDDDGLTEHHECFKLMMMGAAEIDGAVRF